MSGSRASARARPARLRMPPESSEGIRPPAAPSPTRESFSRTSAAIEPASRRVNISSGRATFSATVIELQSAPFWNSTPKRRPISVRRASAAAQ